MQLIETLFIALINLIPEKAKATAQKFVDAILGEIERMQGASEFSVGSPTTMTVVLGATGTKTKQDEKTGRSYTTRWLKARLGLSQKQYAFVKVAKEARGWFDNNEYGYGTTVRASVLFDTYTVDGDNGYKNTRFGSPVILEIIDVIEMIEKPEETERAGSTEQTAAAAASAADFMD